MPAARRRSTKAAKPGDAVVTAHGQGVVVGMVGGRLQVAPSNYGGEYLCSPRSVTKVGCVSSVPTTLKRASSPVRETVQQQQHHIGGTTAASDKSSIIEHIYEKMVEIDSWGSPLQAKAYRLL